MDGYCRLLALSERCPPGMQKRDSWSIKDFVLVKSVGSGAASVVYYGVCRRTTLPCAVKVYLKSKLSKLNRKQVEREIAIHSSLSHPHIIDFYAAFEDAERVYLVLEFAAGGDLFDDVKRRGGRLSEGEVVQNILYPYLSALLYLHTRGIIHRDIKPENTVFTKDKVLKVTDFGLAIDATAERPVTRLGTLDYMSPEVLRCPDKHDPADNKHRADLAYSLSVDSWAVGVLAYELIVGRPPFGMSCREATMQAIANASPFFPDWMSPGAADFIRQALQRLPNHRASIVQLLQHPWIAAYVQVHVPRDCQGSVVPSGASLSTSTASASSYPFFQAWNAGQQQRMAEAVSAAAAAVLQSCSPAHPLQLQQAAALGARRMLQRACSALPSEPGLQGGPSSAGNSTSASHTGPGAGIKTHDNSYWLTQGSGFADDSRQRILPSLAASAACFATQYQGPGIDGQAQQVLSTGRFGTDSAAVSASYPHLTGYVQPATSYPVPASSGDTQPMQQHAAQPGSASHAGMRDLPSLKINTVMARPMPAEHPGYQAVMSPTPMACMGNTAASFFKGKVHDLCVSAAAGGPVHSTPCAGATPGRGMTRSASLRSTAQAKRHTPDCEEVPLLEPGCAAGPYLPPSQPSSARGQELASVAQLEHMVLHRACNRLAKVKRTDSNSDRSNVSSPYAVAGPLFSPFSMAASADMLPRAPGQQDGVQFPAGAPLVQCPSLSLSGPCHPSLHAGARQLPADSSMLSSYASMPQRADAPQALAASSSLTTRPSATAAAFDHLSLASQSCPNSPALAQVSSVSHSRQLPAAAHAYLPAAAHAYLPAAAGFLGSAMPLGQHPPSQPRVLHHPQIPDRMHGLPGAATQAALMAAHAAHLCASSCHPQGGNYGHDVAPCAAMPPGSNQMLSSMYLFLKQDGAATCSSATASGASQAAASSFFGPVIQSHALESPCATPYMTPAATPRAALSGPRSFHELLDRMDLDGQGAAAQGLGAYARLLQHAAFAAHHEQGLVSGGYLQAPAAGTISGSHPIQLYSAGAPMLACGTTDGALRGASVSSTMDTVHHVAHGATHVQRGGGWSSGLHSAGTLPPSLHARGALPPSRLAGSSGATRPSPLGHAPLGMALPTLQVPPGSAMTGPPPITGPPPMGPAPMDPVMLAARTEHMLGLGYGAGDPAALSMSCMEHVESMGSMHGFMMQSSQGAGQAGGACESPSATYSVVHSSSTHAHSGAAHDLPCQLASQQAPVQRGARTCCGGEVDAAPAGGPGLWPDADAKDHPAAFGRSLVGSSDNLLGSEFRAAPRTGLAPGPAPLSAGAALPQEGPAGACQAAAGQASVAKPRWLLRTSSAASRSGGVSSADAPAHSQDLQSDAHLSAPQDVGRLSGQLHGCIMVTADAGTFLGDMCGAGRDGDPLGWSMWQDDGMSEPLLGSYVDDPLPQHMAVSCLSLPCDAGC